MLVFIVERFAARYTGVAEVLLVCKASSVSGRQPKSSNCGTHRFHSLIAVVNGSGASRCLILRLEGPLIANPCRELQYTGAEQAEWRAWLGTVLTLGSYDGCATDPAC